MQVSVEHGEGLERRMTVGLEPEQVEERIEKRLRDFARTARIPGFRPGKVPLKVLRRRFHRQFASEVFGALLQPSYEQAIAQEELHPVGLPNIEADIDVAAGHYAFTAQFEVLPQFELATLAGQSLPVPHTKVEEADVEALIQHLREQHKTFETREGPAQLGDRLILSFAGTYQGEPFANGSADRMPLELGSERMIPGFESGLIGIQAGEQRTLDLRFPATYPKEDLRDQPVSFAVTVHEVSEPRLPPVDEEFAKNFGIEDGDLARFRQDVRANMERELRQRIAARIKKQAMDLLLETNVIPVPQVLLKQEIASLKNQMLERLQGHKKPQFELPDSLFENEAQRRVALGLILAEVVRVNNIQVDPQRVREAVEDLASSYEDPKQVVDYYYGNREQLASVEALTLENQVVDWVKTQVEVKEVATTFQEIAQSSPS